MVASISAKRAVAAGQAVCLRACGAAGLGMFWLQVFDPPPVLDKPWF
jgi:hypothetical protein